LDWLVLVFCERKTLLADWFGLAETNKRTGWQKRKLDDFVTERWGVLVSHLDLYYNSRAVPGNVFSFWKRVRSQPVQ